MKTLLLAAVGFLAVVPPVHAQGFGPFSSSETCYSWNGGNFSAGSYFKCDPWIVVVKEPVKPPKVEVQSAPPPPPPPPPPPKKING
jgi:hypothetical protein